MVIKITINGNKTVITWEKGLKSDRYSAIMAPGYCVKGVIPVMKRITSFLLAIIMFAGLLLTGAPIASAASEMTVSDNFVEFLKKEEGFAAKPYWDYSQYTVGYGTRCPDDMLEEYKENGITKEEAEVLLRNYLSNLEKTINKKFIDKYNVTLTQGQFDAIVSFTYNCGSGWISRSDYIIHSAIRKGATGSELINAFAIWCTANGSILPGLVRRRLCEANMYLNEKYSNSKPSDYCYVYYNANGGSVDYRLQGYDASEGVAPAYKATATGRKFLGWYTEKTGGTEVTKLTKELNGETLYARWDGEPPVDEPAIPVDNIQITVIATDVNLRQGPGTNYKIMGTANKGDQFVITEVDKCDTYTWGKAGEVWICLEFTDYEAIIKDQGKDETTAPTETTVPDTTVPEVTVPETTVPETTVPEVTVPETTVPETTVPEVTVPETTEPQAVTGVVKVSSTLAVRKGPGTGYDIVRYLKNGTKVTILAQEKAGSVAWGKIGEDEWISLRYVELDKEPETTVPDTTVPEPTVPDTTVPDVTVPEPTEPEVTEPTQKPVTGTVKVSTKLKVRKGPGGNYDVVDNLNNGTKVTITEQKTVDGTTWAKIGENRWVSIRYIVLDKETPEEPAQKPVTGTVKVSTQLKVRKGPGSNYAVVENLKNGTKVTITEQKTVDGTTWAKIGENRWVSIRYIVLDKESSEEPAQKPVTGIVKVSTQLKVRKGPGNNYAIVKYLKNGEKVTITEQKTVDGTTWAKIGENQWTSIRFIVLDGEKEDTTFKTVTADCLNVRETPSTSAKIVGYYYEGEKVQILETQKVGSITWGKTSIGWVSLEYIK